ncbi:MAG: GHKL domain-containing protein [Verrucomicrobia bacterium]|nr:GHKL domain-containing protein [Cytophagales bacterium]
MFFSPRIVAFLLAVCVALITTAFLSLVREVPALALVVVAGLSFASCFLLVYLSLEFLVFREINKIYSQIDKLRQKDFRLPKKKINTGVNPLRMLNAELVAYTSKKQQEIDELKRLEIYRREFLADVSHELKTPIFSAQGFIHTLLEGASEDKEIRDRFLQKAGKSLDGLSELVQDLLTVSQMESGDIQMKKQACDLYSLTQEVFEELEDVADKRKVSLAFEKKSLYPANVQADRFRLRQVLNNLIENSIKYGNETGKVRVSFTEDKDMVVIAVKDDGPGIEVEHHKRIFERFYRVEKSRSKDKGGTGLGLAIVKHIIEAHGSKVSVSSKSGKGTVFSFRLEKA